MKQAVLEGPKRFVVQEVPKPEAVAGTLVVKVRFTSICGSDIHIWEWGPDPRDPKARHAFEAVSQAFFGFPPTYILGHQISGEIVEIGDRESPFRKGQRVVIRGAGGYAEYALAMGMFGATLAEVVYPLPDEVSDEQGALVEPLSVAVDVVRRSGLRLGDVVVVQGAGTIGLFVTQCARAAGARKVFVTEVSPLRIQRAAAFGADAVINPRQEDPVERVRDLTGGFGPDFVFDCAGNPEATRTMFDMLPFGGKGKAIVVATYGYPFEIDLNLFMLKNLEVRGFLSGVPGTWEPRCDPFRIAIDLLRSGKVRTDGLVTAIEPLERINEAFSALSKAEQMVGLIRP
jgi:(R,R)-butanediol dehydrogenase/meso-butanediol dehydrogenase/diacetyl reductase